MLKEYWKEAWQMLVYKTLPWTKPCIGLLIALSANLLLLSTPKGNRSDYPLPIFNYG